MIRRYKIKEIKKKKKKKNPTIDRTSNRSLVSSHSSLLTFLVDLKGGKKGGERKEKKKKEEERRKIKTKFRVERVLIGNYVEGVKRWCIKRWYMQNWQEKVKLTTNWRNCSHPVPITTPLSPPNPSSTRPLLTPPLNSFLLLLLLLQPPWIINAFVCTSGKYVSKVFVTVE